MLKISFTNAEVSDHGYGLEVNGKSLEDIISTALGTKVKGNGGYGSGLPSFSSNSCDVTVTINPHDNECEIETEDNVWHSVEEMEAEKSEQFQEENAEADPENNGTLLHKKVVARKMGCKSVEEYNRRMARREKNLKEMEDNKDGK